MARDRQKFTVRMDAADVAEVDRLRVLHGFSTRSKFLASAALSYGSGPAEDDEIIGCLSRLAYQLHQLVRAERGELNLLKDADIAQMSGEVRRAMRQVLERAAR